MSAHLTTQRTVDVTIPIKVLDTAALARLAAANEAVRQLRRCGCKVIRVTHGDDARDTEIVIDRNPHATLSGCPGVHVTIDIERRH